ncbi:MAG: hypothetical protein M3P22_01835 [bacterium]|nr:hypothetical protein [bacterium]
MAKFFTGFFSRFFLVFLLILFIFIFSSETTYAFFSSSSVLGGTITNTQADKIETAEGSGYDCEVRGKTIQVKSARGSTAYFIPTGVRAKTRNSISRNQKILGKHRATETIVCTRDEKDAKTSRIEIILPKIMLYGLSSK